MVASTLPSAGAPAKGMATCSLCEQITLHPLRNGEGHLFCCAACLEVAALLAEPVSSGAAGKLAATGEHTEATLETTTISLAGLWCSSCTWLVSEQLRRTPGVDQAETSFIQSRAQVRFNPAVTNPRQLKRRVGLLGYRAWLENEKPYDEEDAFLTRLLIGGVLVMHDMLVSFSIYGREWLGLANPESAWLVNFFYRMMFVTSIPLLILFGLPILRAGLASLLRGQPNTHTLIAIGSFAAWGLSVRNFFSGQGHVYFDTTSMLLFLVTIGRWLEMQAHKASSQAVERLRQQIPPTATLVTPEGEQTVPADSLRPGNRLRVRPGERFPVDGRVALGQGDVDESLLTGEPEPILRQPGDAVWAGSINLDGALEVIASAVGEHTAAGQIGKLLHEALWQKSPVERLADRLAAWMTPIAIAMAGLAFAFWHVRAGPEEALMVALSVLLIACPCALGLATPLTLWLALTRAAESGVILRSTAALERLAGVKQVLFDKTGTLTRLPMQVQAIAVNEGSEELFLSRTAGVESLSEHPLAKAVVGAAAERGLVPPAAGGFQARPGLGVCARIADLEGERPAWVGSDKLMKDAGLLLPPDLANKANTWREQGLLVVFAGWDGTVRGAIGIGETARPEVNEALAQIQARGLQTGILTGDDEQAGRRWQAALNVPVWAGLHPNDKLSHLQRQSEPTAMVGDGLNDGPALAAADVGLALAHGTDVARYAAEVILVRDDLRLTAWLVDLSRQTMQRVRQNLVWAFIYNVIGLAFAVSGLLLPVLSALAMLLSSVLVTANAMRLKKFPLFTHAETALPGFEPAQSIQP